jgi:hypothetical protein
MKGLKRQSLKNKMLASSIQGKVAFHDVNSPTGYDLLLESDMTILHRSM